MYLLDVLHHFSSYFDVYTDTHRHHLQKILQTILIYRKGGMTSHSKQQIFICTWYVYIYIYTPKYHVDFLNSSPYIINYIYIYHIYICIYLWIRMTFSTIPWMPACLFLGSFWTFKAKNMVETISAAYANAPILDHIMVALKGLEGACSDPKVVQLGSWTNIGK